MEKKVAGMMNDSTAGKSFVSAEESYEPLLRPSQ